MLMPPDIPASTLLHCLKNDYGIDAAAVTFLPLGADFDTAVYRVRASKQGDWFLKLRRGAFNQASVLVPKYLSDMGLKHIIAPLETQPGALWTQVEGFTATFYPYIEGCNGVESRPSKAQWQELGTIVKALHEAKLPQAIAQFLPRECFEPKGLDVVCTFLDRVKQETFADPIAAKMEKVLQANRSELIKMIQRTQTLSERLKEQSLPFVVCHADLHGWNLFIRKDKALYLVDWDTLILAPKERDLMFIGAGIWDSGRTPAEEAALFYQGYGQVEVNSEAIAYYRMARIIEDIAEYCELIFESGADEADRAQALQYVQANFAPGGTVERAWVVDTAWT